MKLESKELEEMFKSFLLDGFPINALIIMLIAIPFVIFNFIKNMITRKF